MMRAFLVVALLIGSPALAQHAGHGAPLATAPPAATDPACPPEHAAMGHCTPTTPAPAAADPACPPEHAAMGHCKPSAQASGAPPVAPPPPEAFQGPEHAGETVFDPALFRAKRQTRLIAEHGGFTGWMLLADQLEYQARDGRDGFRWDAQGWYGGDYDRLWLKSEGEVAFGEAPEQAEVQALYSRAIDPWFNLQIGVRHDFRPDPERTHVVLGIQGLAPYWFEIDGALFLSNKGDLTARIEAEYDQRITNRLILQPLVEFDLAAQDIPELGVGAGLSSVEAGLRLRYQFVPEFAPYVGVEYARKLGDTARFARAAGEDRGGWSLLIGLRTWF
jgi:copper resistance protein B